MTPRLDSIELNRDFVNHVLNVDTSKTVLMTDQNLNGNVLIVELLRIDIKNTIDATSVGTKDTVKEMIRKRIAE